MNRRNSECALPSKAAEHRRTPRRCRAIHRFLVPMHAENRKGALHEPQSRAGVPPALSAKPTEFPLALSRSQGRRDACPALSRSGSWSQCHAYQRKKAFHELHIIRVRARIESGGGPPHSKTLARWPPSLELPPGFGVRRPCGALAMQASQPKAPQDWRSPRRNRAIRRFMVPMHGREAEGAFHEPYS